MKIPKRVKVVGYTYQIKRKNKPFVSDDNNAVCEGHHSFLNQVIKVTKTGSKEFQETIFLHELTHAIISVYCGLDYQNEEFVESFSKGLYQVLNENEIF